MRNQNLNQYIKAFHKQIVNFKDVTEAEAKLIFKINMSG